MTQFPEPLVKPDVDLRDFAFMPLDVLRLRDSELSAVSDAEVFRCAVLSWCVSWHQVPAASLPDDDALLCRLLGFGRDLKGWKRVRDAGGLRGWVKCEDGRLYHPVVAEKARDAWRGKLEQRWRTEAARVKKHNQRHGLEGANAVRMPDLEAWIEAGCPQGHPLPVPRDTPPVSPRVPRETASKGQGEGQGQGQGEGINKTPSGSGRATRLPPDWTPGPEGFAFASKEGLRNGHAEAELAKFRDFWAAKPGEGGRKLDWQATWRNWVRRAVADSQRSGGPRPSSDDPFAGAH